MIADINSMSLDAPNGKCLVQNKMKLREDSLPYFFDIASKLI